MRVTHSERALERGPRGCSPRWAECTESARGLPAAARVTMSNESPTRRYASNARIFRVAPRLRADPRADARRESTCCS